MKVDKFLDAQVAKLLMQIETVFLNALKDTTVMVLNANNVILLAELVMEVALIIA
jgi:hypothetical protein